MNKKFLIPLALTLGVGAIALCGIVCGTTIRNLENENIELKVNVENSQKELEDYKSAYALLNTELIKTNENLLVATNNIRLYETEVATLTNEKTNILRQLETATEDKEELENRLEVVNVELSTACNNLESSYNGVADIYNYINNYTGTENAITVNATNYEATHESILTTLEDVHEQVNALNARITQLQGDINREGEIYTFALPYPEFVTSVTIANELTGMISQFAEPSNLTSLSLDIHEHVIIQYDDSVPGLRVYLGDEEQTDKQLIIYGASYVGFEVVYEEAPTISNIMTCTYLDDTIQEIEFEGEITDNSIPNRMNLISIIIPNSVTNIGMNAFIECTNLTSVVISKGVTSIGDYAFEGCTSLTNIELPNSVTNIGMNAFSYCGNLTSIEIPDSVTSIGNNAFGNTGLISIEIPNSVTSIARNMFNGCSGLTSIEIPDSVTSIGNSAFYMCSCLTNIELPNSVINIGDAAFSDCTDLTRINYTGTMAQWNAISKGISWNENIPATEVICSDGNVNLVDDTSSLPWV